MTTSQVSYDRMARIYESLGYVYSGLQIYNSKASQVAHIRPGDRVLYAGVGPGEDAVLAAQCGAQVTCLDLSPSMLRQAERRIHASGLEAEFICGDVLAHARAGYYDVVVANYFLNMFTEPDMCSMLAALAQLARPEGKVLISDFMPPEGNWLSHAAQSAYWGVTNIFYYLLRLSAWHPVYDYPRYFAAAGLECLEIQRFRPFGVLPVGYCAVAAVRCAVLPSAIVPHSADLLPSLDSLMPARDRAQIVVPPLPQPSGLA